MNPGPDTGSDPVLVYGATGYTGRLVAEQLVRRGIRPIVAGRDATRVGALGATLGCATRVAPLDDADRLAAALEGVRIVLLAAGPFSQTARAMVAACLTAGVHYLDLAGELAVYDELSRLHEAAQRRGVMLMPGVGFDVVASDSLAVHLARRLGGVRSLAVGLAGFRMLTRGSARTLLEHAGRDVQVRRGGRLVPVPPGTVERSFDFGDGPRPSLNVGWGDLVTGFWSTGATEIETYIEATPILRSMLTASRAFGPLLRSGPWQALARAAADVLPEGPAPAELGGNGMVIVAEASDVAGHTVRARLQTPDAYTFSGMAAAAIAERAVGGAVEPGFQTPARVHGPDLVLGLPGVRREDLP